MVRSNEFTADSFAGAIRKATAAYDRSQMCEVKNQRRCNDLIVEINGFTRQATRFADEAERLEDDAEGLRREARDAGLIALASALGGVIGWAFKAKRIARTVGRMRKGNFSRETILEFLQIFGPIGSAFSFLRAVEKIREAEELLRRAQDLNDRAESVGEDLLQAVDEYDSIGCGEDPNFTGS